MKIYDLYDYICHIISGTKFNMAIIHIKTVPPNNILFGGTVPPNNFLFGGTVPPNNFLFGGTVPPNSFPHTIKVLRSQVPGRRDSSGFLLKGVTSADYG